MSPMPHHPDASAGRAIAAALSALALIGVTLTSAPVSAHGSATLCVKAQGDVQECGEGHTCEVFAQVSTEIGVCQEPTTSFRTCDRRRGDEDCPGGQTCKIGDLDPNIGACLGDEEHLHGDSSCQVARLSARPGGGQAAPGAAVLCASLMLVGALRRAGARRGPRRA